MLRRFCCISFHSRRPHPSAKIRLWSVTHEVDQEKPPCLKHRPGPLEPCPPILAHPPSLIHHLTPPKLSLSQTYRTWGQAITLAPPLAHLPPSGEMSLQKHQQLGGGNGGGMGSDRILVPPSLPSVKKAPKAPLLASLFRPARARPK
ncbi:E3 ubiquitin-protein ligase RNF19A [Lates japonicus]|uniref:E3 ubiquitin-protein ligase RNF19A n=1 Tax=Lates japonicus TaxID=270547 RepID=A0AAD3M7K6_LATJO|nr:E3 ubiquitin-protein ligase RNF19A [Lates japonicus]